jgi:hypothetical protein
MTNDTDWYGIAETGLVNRFNTLTEHFPHAWQVSDDDTVLGQGAEKFLIYRPGGFPVADISMGEKDITWEVKCRLHIKYRDYKSAWTTFKAVRKDIINLIIPDYSLGDTKGVWRVGLSSDEDAQYFFFDEPKPGVRPNFIIQDMTVSIAQRCGFEV